MAVTDEAILKIKEMIVSGELAPGDRLPPEKELSESLGLSRNSLREAVKALELIRVLDVRRGDGTYVTSLEPSLLLEALSFVADIHQDASVLELFEVRRILEPAAAALAAASPGARLVQLGSAAAAEMAFNPGPLRGRVVTIQPFSSAAVPLDQRLAAYRRTLDFAARGELTARVRELPLAEAPRGWELQRQGPGAKLLLRVA